jgi:hypothetical protein
MLRPHCFQDVGEDVAPLVQALLDNGLYERLTDCMQVYVFCSIVPPSFCLCPSLIDLLLPVCIL